MSLVIELPDDAARTVTAEAKRLGVSPKRYVLEKMGLPTDRPEQAFDKGTAHGRPPLVPRDPATDPLILLLKEQLREGERWRATATPEEIAEAQADVDEFLANVRKNRVNIGNRSGLADEDTE